MTTPGFPVDAFVDRHVGPRGDDRRAMLEAVGVDSLDQLVDEAIPASIRLTKPLALDPAESEAAFLARLRTIASGNQLFRSYIGLGYYGTVLPAVIRRTVFENPSWYTPYTPYQAEIAQGRLEALLNFQTMVRDLTGMEVANASLLDEATAAAESMTLLRRVSRKPASANVFLVADTCFPQTLAVLASRAEPLGLDVRVVPAADLVPSEGVYGMLLQYPDANGEIVDVAPAIARARDAGVLVAVASDLLALTLLVPPGEMGADVVLGSAQRFGVPMGYGGPHAAFFATRESFVRQSPGRIIGVSIDAHGNPALRMALQTREQHIRREKATSNICTAQALLANMAGFYGVYHGPEGLKGIATRVHAMAVAVAGALGELGFVQRNAAYFDTLRVAAGDRCDAVTQAAERHGINFRDHGDGDIGISLDETVQPADVVEIVCVFAEAAGKKSSRPAVVIDTSVSPVPAGPATAVGVHDAPGLPPPPVGDADDALRQGPRAQGRRPRHVDDPARVLHDEAQRGGGDAPGHLAGVLAAAPVRPARADEGLRPGHRGTRGGAPRGDGLRGGVPAAELRGAGRAHGLAGHSRLSPLPRRPPSQRGAHSLVCAWHEPRQRRDGGHEGGGRRVRRQRQRRRRRPAREGAAARERPVGADGDLPLDARRVRGRDSRDLRDRARARRTGLHGRREHERAGRPHEPRP